MSYNILAADKFGYWLIASDGLKYYAKNSLEEPIVTITPSIGSGHIVNYDKSIWKLKIMVETQLLRWLNNVSTSSIQVALLDKH